MKMINRYIWFIFLLPPHVHPPPHLHLPPPHHHHPYSIYSDMIQCTHRTQYMAGGFCCNCRFGSCT